MSKYVTHGVKTLCNTFSLQIELSNSGDAARLHPTYESKQARPKWQEIKYDKEGLPYVTWYKSVHYLNEFIKF